MKNQFVILVLAALVLLTAMQRLDATGCVQPSCDGKIADIGSAGAAYPHPVGSGLILSIKSDLPGDLSYSIYNVKGQKLYTGEVGGHQREQIIHLDAKIVGNLPNGIYLVNLKQNNRTIASCKAVIVK